jgi:hypothetical protein
MATQLRARPETARSNPLRAGDDGRASTGSRWISAERAARSTPTRRSANRPAAASERSSSLATRSTAPSSSARIAAAVPGPA